MGGWGGGACEQRRFRRGRWYLYVARPDYLTLALAWLWRIVLAFVLFKRLAALPLLLVPTHPDRVGGLGFLESIPWRSHS